MTRLRCFACDKPLGRNPKLVTCADEQDVYVGSGCGTLIERAGAEGWQPPKGGPRLYDLRHDPKDLTTLTPSFREARRQTAAAQFLPSLTA